jgi:hypothetical protein
MVGNDRQCGFVQLRALNKEIFLDFEVPLLGGFVQRVCCVVLLDDHQDSHTASYKGDRAGL